MTQRPPSAVKSACRWLESLNRINTYFVLFCFKGEITDIDICVIGGTCKFYPKFDMNVATSTLSTSHDRPASGSQLHGMGVVLCSSVEGVAVILSPDDTPASSLFLSGKISFMSAPSRVLQALLAAFLLDIYEFCRL